MVLWLTQMPTEILVDVTLRNPLAPKYLHRAATRTHHAIEEATRDKERRYGPITPVVAAAAETYGALSQEMMNLLHALDNAADALAPNTQRRPKLLQWAFRLQTAIARAVARNVHTSTAGGPTQHDHHSHHTDPPSSTSTQRGCLSGPEASDP